MAVVNICNIPVYRILFAQHREKKKEVCIFAAKFQNHKVMDKKNERPPVYKRHKDFCVDLYAHEEPQPNKLYNGRGLLNVEKAEFLFLVNKPAGPRSKEVGRTLHGRFIRRPNGGYTATMRFNASERLIGEQLIAELRDIVRWALVDFYKQKYTPKKEKDETVQNQD